MSAVHVSCRARAPRNILTPSSDMIVPAMTSSIASRSNDAERRKARASPESDAEVRAARHLGTAGEKVPEHGDADEILRSLQSSGLDARLRDDRATVEAVLLHEGLQRAHGADPPKARGSWLICRPRSLCATIGHDRIAHRESSHRWQACLTLGGYGSEDGTRYCPEAH